MSLLTAPSGAQETSPELPADASERSEVLIVPAPPPGSSPWASVEQVTTVDIPQWAKDEGHNGAATYTATVGADGEVVSLRLVTSSRSEAIDEAIRQRAKTLSYGPARGGNGEPAQGVVHLRMSYARYDKDSPGGGVDNYTCGDLVSEYEWFQAAHADRPIPFTPFLVYLTLAARVRMERGENVDIDTVDNEIETRRAIWDEMIEKCKVEPERLMLDLVDYPEDYRRRLDQY